MSGNNDIAILSAADYAVFGVLLAVSATVGIFFAYRDRMKKESKNYLLGDRYGRIHRVEYCICHSFDNTECTALYHLFEMLLLLKQRTKNIFHFKHIFRRKIAWWASSISCALSFLSGATVIGIPAEIMYKGSSYMWWDNYPMSIFIGSGIHQYLVFFRVVDIHTQAETICVW